MDLSKYLPNYPDFSSEDERESPYLKLSRKNEFYETKLERQEPKPTVPGTWMNHQIFMSRFLSGHTPYQSILLMHEPGTGKTCTSVAAIESIRREHSDIQGALVMMSGEGLINNYKNEVVFVCTNGTYLPKDYHRLNKRQRQIRITKSLDKFYEFKTYEKFSSLLQDDWKWNEEYIKNTYSNKIIVLDEVHNLRQHDPNLKQVFQNIKKLEEKNEKMSSDQLRIYNLLSEKYNAENPDDVKLDPSVIKEVQSILALKRYTSIYRFLHIVTNCKILLLSGTPMRDQPTELIDIMNLILPQKLEVNDYFENNSLIENMKVALKNKLRGHVSYLKAMQSDIRKEYMVNPEYEIPLENISLYGLKMSPFQTKYYNQAKQKDQGAFDDKKRRVGVYSNTRQANLFVFPNGTYGSEGYKNFLEYKNIVREAIVSGLTDDMTIHIKRQHMIERLREYSCKYAECIQKIIEKPRETHFIYTEFVKGSGALVFKAILDLFGFSQAKVSVKEDDRQPFMGDEDDEDDDEKEKEKEREREKEEKEDLENMGKKLRYAILTTETSSPKEIVALAKLFNRDENKDGEYIQIIIGSSVVSEGFTLKNVQHVHILTPDWNFSSLDQIIARSFRLFSHNALLRAYPDRDIRVKIYLYCAFPSSQDSQDSQDSQNMSSRSIDYHMFKISRDKDRTIKEVERVLKEVSVDCYLNKERNVSQYNVDGSRECEYQNCDYQCDGIPPNLVDIPKSERDYSTYNLYYDEKEINKIKERIKTLFLVETKMKMDDILSILSAERYNELSILKAIYEMIIMNTVMNDRLGYHCFLRNEHDYLYLTHCASHMSTFLDHYYVEHFPLEMYRREQEQQRFIRENTIPSFIRDRDLSRFSPETQELILEESFLNNKEEYKNIFSGHFSILDDGTVVSTLLKPVIRCMPTTRQWQNCVHPEHQVSQSFNFVVDNPWDIVGQIKEDGELYLIVPSDKKIAKNKKEAPTGVRCITGKYQKEGLVNLFIRLRIEMDDDDTGVYTIHTSTLREKCVSILTAYKYKNLDKKTTEELVDLIREKCAEYNKDIDKNNIDLCIRYLYWNKPKAALMCGRLREWLQNHQILFDEKGVVIAKE